MKFLVIWQQHLTFLLLENKQTQLDQQTHLLGTFFQLTGLETKSLCEKPAPLSQRLFSAFITEDEIANLENDTQGESNLLLSNDHAHYGPNSYVLVYDKDLSKMDCPLDLDYKNQRNERVSDGFMAPNNFKHLNLQNFMSCDDPVVENHTLLDSSNASLSDYQKNDCDLPQTMKGDSPHECQYRSMSLDDRILMELNSIGIYLDTVVCNIKFIHYSLMRVFYVTNL